MATGELRHPAPDVMSVKRNEIVTDDDDGWDTDLECEGTV